MEQVELAEELVKLLFEKGLKIATAESCTGGMVAQNLTAVSGSSNVFDCGIISYANRIKIKELGVSPKTLELYGAVSEQTAVEMARGVMNTASSDIGISTTGIAGPTGGTPEKPIGTVHIAVCMKGKCFHEKLSLLSVCGNNRQKIREAATVKLFQLALKAISE